jgi:hypothetical protein
MNSPWLSERMIARLSPLRRANLERRVIDHCEQAATGCDARGNLLWPGRESPHVERINRVAGRCLMLISNAELREGASRG